MPEDAEEALGMACARSARNLARSFSSSSTLGEDMHRSSESIGATAAELAKAQVRVGQP